MLVRMKNNGNSYTLFIGMQSFSVVGERVALYTHVEGTDILHSNRTLWVYMLEKVLACISRNIYEKFHSSCIDKRHTNVIQKY